MSRDRVARRSREPALGVPIVENQTTTSFEAFREYTSWKRPGRDHGCKPVEIVPGLWTAHCVHAPRFCLRFANKV